MENNHIISIEKAIEITSNYQNSPNFNNQTIACKIENSSLLNLISQPNCESTRFYFALENNLLTLVIVGVDNNNSDITTGVILDKTEKCPLNCDINSVLMQIQ